MNMLLVICLAFAVAQAAPTDNADSGSRYTFRDSKLKSSFEDAVKTAQNEARSVMDQYKDTAHDINGTINEFPDDVFAEAFKSAAYKIKSYSKSLKPIMNDPNSTPQDKAHQVVQSITPLLDGIIADFHSAANNIENYLSSANPSVQDSMNKLQSGSKSSLSNSIDNAKQFAKGLSPEASAILDSLKGDFASQEAQWDSNLDSAQQDLTRYVPQRADFSELQY